MNHIVIHGRITKTPELKTVGSGTEVCNLTVAVNRPVGKGKEKVTDFFDVDAWGQTGVFINKYFGAGDGIFIEGEMRSRKYDDKDGNKRTAWGVYAKHAEFAEKKGGTVDGAANNGGFTEVDDSEMPF